MEKSCLQLFRTCPQEITEDEFRCSGLMIVIAVLGIGMFPLLLSWVMLLLLLTLLLEKT